MSSKQFIQEFKEITKLQDNVTDLSTFDKETYDKIVSFCKKFGMTVRSQTGCDIAIPEYTEDPQEQALECNKFIFSTFPAYRSLIGNLQGESIGWPKTKKRKMEEEPESFTVLYSETNGDDTFVNIVSLSSKNIGMERFNKIKQAMGMFSPTHSFNVEMELGLNINEQNKLTSLMRHVFGVDYSILHQEDSMKFIPPEFECIMNLQEVHDIYKRVETIHVKSEDDSKILFRHFLNRNRK